MPKKGGYCPVFDQIELLGGEAANTACYLTMWRQEVALVGNTIGSGFEGEQLRLMLLEKGLDVHLLSRQGETPVCDVYVTDDGDRTMFGFGFHNEDFCTGRASIPVRKGAWFTADPNIADASSSRCSVASVQAHPKQPATVPGLSDSSGGVGTTLGFPPRRLISRGTNRLL